MKKASTIWILILVAALLLSACGAQPTPEAEQPEATEAVAAEPTAEPEPEPVSYTHLRAHET